jgi:hypothetical protein
MPVMIPSVVDAKAAASERRVFDFLKSIPGSDRWIVLHSLGLSNAYSGAYGEIDFVVLMPGNGMICLEVKGGGVSCKDGVWSSVDQHGARYEYKRSPFAQVKEGMWKLINAIRVHFGDRSLEAQCAVGWLVVFPDCASPPPTADFIREEVIDKGDVLGDWKKRLTNAPSLLSAYEQKKDKPSAAVCDRLLKFLRPSFERICTISSDLWDTEERIRTLTEEQYAVLDGISENQRCLIHGPAGTGKTLLAVEAAKRAASSQRSVLLTCFNRNLGRWLARSLEANQPTIVAGNLHKLLRDRVTQSSVASEFLRLETIAAPKFFAAEYYELGALAISEIGERFNSVMVDEAQDFPVKALQQVVAEWTGDTVGAQIMLFGDFARQSIYDASTRSREDVVAEFPGMASFSLSMNCRNTRRIAKQIELVAGAYGYRISDRQPEGHTVEYFYHSTHAELVDHLEQVGLALRRQGYSPEDIIILSPGRFESGPLSRISRLANWPVKDFETASPHDVARSTIHAFKGLERAAVILAGIDTRNADEADSLLYVGMSRARTRLFLLCSRATQELINARIISNMGLAAQRG